MEFLAMGGYAAFVWPAYGLAVVLLLVLLAVSLRGARACEAELDRLQQNRPRRPDRSAAENSPRGAAGDRQA